GHAVAENAQWPRALDLADFARLQTEVREEWRFLDICALGIPLVHVAGARRDFVPLRILPGEVAVQFLEHLRLQRELHLLGDFLESGPDIFQHDRLAILASTERFAA